MKAKSIYTILSSLLSFFGLYLLLGGWLALLGITEILVTYEFKSIYGLYTAGGVVLLAVLFKMLLSYLKRRNYFSDDEIYDFQTSFMRFIYSANILTYGFSKIFKSQFQYGIITADTPVGQLSSTTLSWYYFGQSYAFACIIGLCQIIASLLIYYRKTSPAGLLMMLPIMMNITLLNFFYDLWFETKIISLAYMLMNIILLLPHLQQLKILFTDTSLFDKTPKGAVLLLSVSIIIPIYGFYKIRNDEKDFYTKNELLGGYKTVTFEKNDTSFNVLHLDNNFWDKIYFDRGHEGKLVLTQDSSASFDYTTTSDSLSFVLSTDSTRKFKGKFSFSGSDSLSLIGQLGTDYYLLLLKRIPIKEPVF